MAKHPKKPLSSYDPKFQGNVPRRPQFLAGDFDMSNNPLGGRPKCGNPNCTDCNPRTERQPMSGDRSPFLYGKSPLADLMNDKNFVRSIFADFKDIRFERVNADPVRPTRTKPEGIAQFLVEFESSTEWNDIIGNPEAKLALQEAIEAKALHSETYEFYGMKPSKGVLLYGPPGCGKTMFAKATGSAMAKLYGKKGKFEVAIISGPALQSKWFGESEKMVRELFAYAAEYERDEGYPFLIFIDEADAMLPTRREGSIVSDIVATFLAEMDGMNPKGQPFIVLATNRPEAIDSAVLRDGRIDRKIKIERPTRNAVIEILENALRGAPLGEEIVFEGIIENLYDDQHAIGEVQFMGVYAESGEPVVGKLPILLRHIVSGALIVGLVAKAKSFAFQRDIQTKQRSGIMTADFLEAIEQVVRDNKGLDHSYAIDDVAKEHQVQQRKGMN